MDGNPNVNAETIAATLRAQRALVLDRYDAEAGELARELSQTSGNAEVDDALLARIEHYRKQLPAVGARPESALCRHAVSHAVRVRARASARDRRGKESPPTPAPTSCSPTSN